MLLEKLEDRRVLATWSGTLTTNTTWPNTEVQEVTSDLTVAEGVTLTIDPGTIVKFSSSSTDLHIGGTLSAIGTVTQNIIFTSRRDDVGGDTNGDGGATLPGPGNWGRINVLSTGSANIDHAHVRYGLGGELTVDGGSLTLTNSIISDSSGNGVRIANADPTLTNNVYEDNNGAAINTDLSSNPVISGVTVTNNVTNGLRVDSGTSTKSLNWTNPDITYLITTDVAIDVGHTLTIGPGQVIKFSSSSADLFVNGSLDAQGLEANPIVFTDDADDTAGGDTNNDGNVSTPVNGAWGRLALSGTSNVMDFVEMRYGLGSMLLIDGATATISNSRFDNSSGDAVRIQNSDPTLTGVSFSGNSGAAVSTDLSSNPVISDVTVSNNATNGLRVDSGTSTKSLNWTNPDITYSITSDITIADVDTLTIGPGQVIKASFSSSDLFVAGTLDAQGTAVSPIVFTHIRDDSAGGDTNNDADTTAPFNGAWGGLVLSGTNNVMDFVEMRYGVDDMLVIEGATTISNSSFDNSSGDAVRIRNADPIMMGVSFAGNSGAAVSTDLSSNPVISGVTVSNNVTNGLRLDTGTSTKSLNWTNPDITYLITSDITIADVDTLTIGPGQVIKSSSTSTDLFVSGTLNAQGTAVDPIVFTDDADDASGGDTNNDADTTVPVNGSWGVLVLSGTDNILDFVEMRYGINNMLLIDGATTTISNSSFDNSSGDAVRIQNSDPTLTGVTFSGNSGAAVSTDLSSNPVISGVTVSDNVTNGLRVDSGTSTRSLNWTNPDITYSITSDITIADVDTLTIGPGQVIKASFSSTDLFVAGTLDAQGTAVSPIVFTHIRDDTSGGDTNNDADATAPSNGTWGRLVLSGTDNVMDFVEMRYGIDNMLLIDGATTTISNSSFDNSSGDAVRIQNADPMLTGVSFAGNSGAAVSADLSSNPVISGVAVTNNATNGLRVDSGTSTKNLNWTNPDISYLITSDVSIDAGHTLTIGPGQVIKASSSSTDLHINGTLDARGTTDNPIVFTDDADDTVGGDTNNDGNATVPVRGGWGRINFNATSVDNVIDHGRLAYGLDAMLNVLSNGLELTNSVARESSGDAIEVNGGLATLESNLIYANSGDGIAAFAGGTVIATNNTINGNFRGVNADGATTSVDLTNNLITFHTRSGVFASGGATVTTSFNDVFNPDSTHGNYEAIPDPTGTDGNLSVDPLYVDATNQRYQLLSGSGAIDAADGDAAPATDFAGNSRFDDPGIANIGTGSEPWYDIGALERQEGSDPMNLIIEAAAVSAASVQIGDQVTINWTVRNNEVLRIEGDWFDSVFVSDDQAWDIGDTLVGTIAINGGLDPNGSYDEQLVFDVPAQLDGTLYFIVRTDAQQALRESVETDNQLIVTAELTIPALQPDVSLNDMFGEPGDSKYYRLDVPVGRTVNLSLDSAAQSGTTALFVGSGRIPTPADHDFRSDVIFSVDQDVLLSGVSSGAHYILARAVAGAAATSEFTLTAGFPGFKTRAISPTTGGNTGEVTITIEAGDLNRISTVSLIADDGTTFAPVETFFGNPAELHATFDLTDVPLGVYDIRILSTQEVLGEDTETGEIGSGLAVLGDHTLPDAFTVVPEEGQLQTVLILPGAARFGRVFPFQLEVANESNVDVPSPVLLVHSPNGTPVSLATTVGPDDLDQQQLMVLSPTGRVSVLSPGERVTVPLYGFASAEPASQIAIQNVSPADIPVDWDALQSTYRDGSTDAEWAVTWANFQSLVGDTLGELHSVMRLAAEELLPDGEVPVLAGEVLISDLLARAAQGQSDTTGFRPVVPGTYEPPFAPAEQPGAVSGEMPITAAATTIGSITIPDANEPSADPDNHDGCARYRAMTFEPESIAAYTATANAAVVGYLAAAHGTDTSDLYAKYLTQNAPSSETITESSPNSKLITNFSPLPSRYGFRHSETTVDVVKEVLGFAVRGIQSRIRLPEGHPLRIDAAKLPDGVVVPFEIRDLLGGVDRLPANSRMLMDGPASERVRRGAELLDSRKVGNKTAEQTFDNKTSFGQNGIADKLVYEHGDIPGRLVGGIGKTNPAHGHSHGSDVYGDDWRNITGRVLVTRSVSNGKTSGIRISTDLDLQVHDTVDFCPGALGESFVLFATVPMSILEANHFGGATYDLELNVNFKTATQSEHLNLGILPNDFDAEPPQPPTCPIMPQPQPGSLVAFANGNGCESTGDDVDTVRPRDPNDITGPAGFGDQGFITVDEPLPYMIRFENDPEQATAPAQEVFITNQLDENMDWLTFELGSIGFGSSVIEVPPGKQDFSTSVDWQNTDGSSLTVDIEAGLNPETGVVSWTFRSLDPDTGLLPFDPFAGFLPPNDETGRGEGFLTYTIESLAGLVTGDAIENQASIVFDVNDAILTNTELNTIDDGDPTSSVTGLPAAAVAHDFMVDWSGQDDVGGSGVASYDIFVSENGGAFSPWLLATTETSDLFTGGVIGSTYGFLSLARDNVGHVEAMPVAADAEIIVGPWVNPINVFDVDAENGPTAFDALLIINELGRSSVSDPDTGVLDELPPSGFAPPYYDVAFDGSISALDALRVINELARLNTGAELVGEQVDQTVFALPQRFQSLFDSSTDPVVRSIFEELNNGESMHVKSFQSKGNQSSDFSSSGNESLASVVEPIGEAGESTLQTLAEDVASQWSLAPA